MIRHKISDLVKSGWNQELLIEMAEKRLCRLYPQDDPQQMTPDDYLYGFSWGGDFMTIAYLED